MLERQRKVLQAATAPEGGLHLGRSWGHDAPVETMIVTNYSLHK